MPIADSQCRSKSDRSCFDVPKRGDERRASTKQKRRHIPHSERSAEFVHRRNTRERRRMLAVNQAFNALKKHLPQNRREVRMSKFDILKGALDYIEQLTANLYTNATCINSCPVMGCEIDSPSSPDVIKAFPANRGTQMTDNYACYSHIRRRELSSQSWIITFVNHSSPGCPETGIHQGSSAWKQHPEVGK